MSAEPDLCGTCRTPYLPGATVFAMDNDATWCEKCQRYTGYAGLSYGTLSAPRSPKITYRDLIELRSAAVRAFVDQGVVPIDGTPPAGLTESDLRALAWFESSLKLAGRLGFLKEGLPDRLVGQAQDESVWEE